MKKLIYLLAVLGLAMTVSCGNSAKREQEIRDSLRADSIMKDSIIRAKIDSIRLDSIRQDSLRRIRVTPDMVFLNVHGPVKMVKDENGKTWEFTPEGKLKSKPSGYICNSEGYVVKEDGLPDYRSTYKYNDNMQLSQYLFENLMAGEYYNGSYSYNEQGFISSDIFKSYSEGSVVVYTTKYKYINLDEYGNWTYRSWTSVHEETTIDGAIYRLPDSGTHRRTITYYE